MDCAELSKFLHAYLDGELVEDDRVGYAAHLRSCDRCRQIANFELAFRERVRDCVEPVCASASLKARVQQALDEVDRPRWWLQPWFRRAVPVAVGLAGLAVFVVWQRSAQQQRLSQIAEASISYHRQRLPMDVQGSSPEPIRRYFSDKVGFAVHLPRFAGRHAELMGARLTQLREHKAAYLVYRVDGQRVSVFIVDPGALPGEAQSRPVFLHDARGYRAAVFRRGGTGFAVTSDTVDPGGLVQRISFER